MIVDQLTSALEEMSEYEEARLWHQVAVEVMKHTVSNQNAIDEGYFHNPHATKFCSFADCKREAAFNVLGYEREEPIGWRGRNTFATGHLLEAWLKALMHYAWIPFRDKDSFDIPEWVTKDGYQVRVTPDAVIPLNDDDRQYLRDEYGIDDAGERACIEIKSTSTKGFSYWTQVGVEAAKPGYYDQAQLEMYGTDTQICIFLVMDKNTGALHQEIVRRDEDRIAELDDLFFDIFRHTDPFAFDIPYAPEAVTKYIRGQKNEPEDCGKPYEPAYNSRGHHIGWRVTEGHKIPVLCGYCGYKDQCWKNEGYEIELSFEDDNESKPVWLATSIEDGDGDQ